MISEVFDFSVAMPAVREFMASKKQTNFGRIATNMATTVLSEIVNKLSPLIILHIAQKRLGIEMFGLAQYAIVFLEVLLPFVAFGYGTLGAIEVGRIKADRKKTGEFISTILGLRVLHLVSVLLIGGVLVLQPAFAESRPLILCISFMLVASCFETEFLHYGQQTISVRNLIVVGSKLISVIGIVLLVHNEADVSRYAVLATLPALLVSAGSAWYNLRNLPLRIPEIDELKSLFTRSLPYAFVIFLITLSDRYDVFFAEYFFGKSGAGFYAGQLRIIQSLASATSAFGLVFFTELVVPRLKEDFTRYVNYTLTTILIFIAPIVIGGLYVDTDILCLIYNEDFVPYVKVLDVLLLSIFAGAFFQVFGVYILLIKEKVTFFNVALAVGNVGGILVATLLVGSMGLTGIAIGNLTTKCLAAGLFVWGAKEYISSFPWVPTVKILGCSGFMAAALTLSSPDDLVAKIAIGALAYSAATVVTQFQFIQVLLHRILKKTRPE